MYHCGCFVPDYDVSGNTLFVGLEGRVQEQ